MSRREHPNDQTLDPTTSASHPAMSLTMIRDRSAARGAAAMAASISQYWPLWVTGHRVVRRPGRTAQRRALATAWCHLKPRTRLRSCWTIVPSWPPSAGAASTGMRRARDD